MGLLDGLFGKKEAVPPTVVTDENWEEVVLRSDKPVLVDFSSATCAPCQKLKPVLAQVQSKYPEVLTVAFAEVGKTRRAAGKLGIRSTPTLVLFDKGKERGRVSGYRPRSYWEGMVEAELLGGP
jgi:thioredoxin-like negative regulator of GroEL